ncbi:SusC/RagA family TonB-linked outer membrane protein [Chitinophaga lutea]
MMKLAAIIVCVCTVQAFALTGYSQDRVSLNLRQAPLKKVLKAIERQTSIHFVYNDEILDTKAPADVLVTDKAWTEAVTHLLRNTGLTFKQVDENLVVITPAATPVQIYDMAIRGKVVMKDNQPLPGVTIVEKGTINAVTSGVDGSYSIKVKDASAILVFKYIGFVTQELPVSGVLNVTMEEDHKALDEVVVVGYGEQKKINLTGAVDVVRGEMLANRPSANMGELLQGASPNLNIGVTSTGGEPGAGRTWNIRGLGSLSGSAPLVLVDGVEMNINNLNPESVESVTVLKDAAASAIYGARAPFGVILITTKKGSAGKMQIQYTYNLGLASPINLPKWHSSLEYVTARNQALTNAGLAPKFPTEQIDRIKRYIDGTYKPEYDTANPPPTLWRGRHDGNANYEWFDEYFKDQVANHKHGLSLSGGTDKTQYYISLGYFQQGSSYNWADEDYKRYNLVSNLSTQATKWLNVSLNTKFASSMQHHPIGSSGLEKKQIISEMMKFYPTTPMYNWNGTINNPYVQQLMNAGLEKMRDNDFWTTIAAELEPVKDWKSTVSYSYNYYGGKYTKHDKQVWLEAPNGTQWNIGSPENGFAQDWDENYYSFLSATSAYQKELGKHFLRLMVGYEQEYKQYNSLSGSKRGLATEEVPAIRTATGAFQVNDAMSHWATRAFFSRFNYNYKEKYLLELNARYGGSSRFAPDERWGLFPSFSAGYNISRENFWRGAIAKAVDNLKVRASYGTLGNQNVANYLYMSIIPISNNLEWILNDIRPNFAGIPAIKSPNLTWERISTLDFGVDAAMLNGRMNMTFDWYNRRTTRMFGPSVTLPAALGTGVPQENNASLSTKGWELSLSWKDNISKDLFYNVRVSFADYRSVILEYRNDAGLIDSYYKGKVYGEIWGYTSDGLIQTAGEKMPDQSKFFNKWGPGDMKFKDLDGNDIINDGRRTLADHGDLRVIGNNQPRYNYGLSAGLTWKNIDFSMFWQGIGKRNLAVSSAAANTLFWGLMNAGEAYFYGHEDYWRPANETNILGPNTDAYFPKPYESNETYKNLQTQTRYLLNGAYLRLKNAQIGYALPRWLTSKAAISSLKVYVSGENLLTFQKMPKRIDPETAFTSIGSTSVEGLGKIYPLSRVISFGLNITF